nr:MAG TPA: hypothetical protein [Caudoviricetes sp.]
MHKCIPNQCCFVIQLNRDKLQNQNTCDKI